MYAIYSSSEYSRSRLFSQSVLIAWVLGFFVAFLSAGSSAVGQPEVIRNITQPSERIELTVNSSRILTLEKRIPRIVVNNPELVAATPISANQIQLAALKPGVTQINLWDEEGQVFTVDLLIYGDVRELEHALTRLFPESSVKVMRLTNSLVLEGFVERPEAVGPIIRLAEDYAPKIVNNITVGGVQQVLLKVKVMEVSRTKLRNLGVDWALLANNGYVGSSVAGLITDVFSEDDALRVTSVGAAANETFQFGVLGSGSSFFAFLEALQQNNMAKVLADPTITSVSGRPAHFNVGGELPVIVPGGTLGQTTVEFKKFGTQVDFVPIVLGNGNIRLEIRPRVSELDPTRGTTFGNNVVPALKVREVDTGVELKAGQTLALAGLVQTRVEASERSLPFVGNLPLVGAAFRRVSEEVNEIELLIMVTPELVDGMDPHEVPVCGPGMETVSPSTCQLYFGGHLEVPATGPCAPPNCGPGCQMGGSGYPVGPGPAGTSPIELPRMQPAGSAAGQGSPPQMPAPGAATDSVTVMPPVAGQQQLGGVSATRQVSAGKPRPNAPALRPSRPSPQEATAEQQNPTAKQPVSAWRANQPQREMPVEFSRDTADQPAARPALRAKTATPGLIGPLGYDVKK